MAALTIEQAFQLGLAHQQCGRLTEAETLCRQILAVQPEHADSLNLLGVMACMGERHEAGIPLLLKATALAPQNPFYLCNLGEAYRNTGLLDEAIATFKRALSFKPDIAEAYSNMGAALRNKGLVNEALEAAQMAVALKPGFAEALNNLGCLFRELSRPSQAVQALQLAIQARPEYAEAFHNLSLVYRDLGDLDQSVKTGRQALHLHPDNGKFQFNMAALLLLGGDFANGWPLLESRWSLDEIKASRRSFDQPMWKGERIEGRRILIHAEQGYGDTIQCLRYVPMIARQGACVIVECQQGLKGLLGTLDGVCEIFERDESLPAFDFHCPVMSLPLAFGTRMETIPAHTPYLGADAEKAAWWQRRLVSSQCERGNFAHPLHVGLVWAGGQRPEMPNIQWADFRRSLALARLAPLAAVPGVVFVSLQKGPPSEHAKAPPKGMTLLDWTDELHDFADTAALAECLDLVISVDTAVVHLAGALGKPVWMLNPFATDWRWILEREDSPWYPTMRIFRQLKPGDWDPVIARVAESLRALATHRLASATQKP